MKNKLFVLFLLSGLIAHAEQPLSPEEREKSIANLRQETICYAVLFNLYNSKLLSKNNVNLTTKELEIMARLDAAFKTFKCENHKNEAFKVFDIDHKMNLLDKAPISELSIEKLEKSEIIEQQFMFNLTKNKYRDLALQRRLGLTQEEFNALNSQWNKEFNHLAKPDNK
jgi:hypothetical protein